MALPRSSTARAPWPKAGRNRLIATILCPSREHRNSAARRMAVLAFQTIFTQNVWYTSCVSVFNVNKFDNIFWDKKNVSACLLFCFFSQKKQNLVTTQFLTPSKTYLTDIFVRFLKVLIWIMGKWKQTKGNVFLWTLFITLLIILKSVSWFSPFSKSIFFFSAHRPLAHQAWIC